MKKTKTTKKKEKTYLQVKHDPFVTLYTCTIFVCFQKKRGIDFDPFL